MNSTVFNLLYCIERVEKFSLLERHVGSVIVKYHRGLHETSTFILHIYNIIYPAAIHVSLLHITTSTATFIRHTGTIRNCHGIQENIHSIQIIVLQLASSTDGAHLPQ